MSRVLKWSLRIGAILVLGAFIAFTLLYTLVRQGYYGELPTLSDLRDIENFQTTLILDKDEKLIGKFYIQDRSSIPYDSISEELIQTLVAVEDKRFYEHGGIDYKSLLRVLVKSILLGNESAGGGSTITQQLVKNLYPRKDYGWLYYPVNKMREMIIATEVEALYSKEEILALYLNTVPFGLDLYGIQSASLRFFDKPASQLNWQESATMVGMLKATTYYNPLVHPEQSIERRNFILKFLAREDHLDSVLADSLLGTPLGTGGIAAAYRYPHGYLRTRVINDATLILNEELGSNNYDLQRDGFRIYTTIDLNLQEISEAAMREHLSALQELLDKQLDDRFWNQHRDLIDSELRKITHNPRDEKREISVYSYADSVVRKKYNTVDSIRHHLSFLQSGILTTSPASGAIRTWAGGIDHYYFPYDHVTSERQVGSTIKPFIYAAALEKSVDPCEYFHTGESSYLVKGETWTPRNANEEEEGRMTMELAMERSVNTVAVKILKEAGISHTINLLRNAGITADIPDVPSLALGTPSLSLYEMVQAYSIFVNEGRMVPLYLIERIEDSQGNIVYQRMQPESRRVISRETSLIIRYFLENAVDEGTGMALRSTYRLTSDMGGKTGTSQNGADGWFIGITPSQITGIWVGGNYPSIRFRTGRTGQGARLALPVYGKIYSQVEDKGGPGDSGNSTFTPIPEHIARKLDCDPFKKEFKLFDWLFNRNKEGDQENEADPVEWKEDSTRSNKKPGLVERIKSLFNKDKDH